MAEKKSIFDLADKFGYKSIWENWLPSKIEDFDNGHNSDVYNIKVESFNQQSENEDPFNILNKSITWNKYKSLLNNTLIEFFNDSEASSFLKKFPDTAGGVLLNVKLNGWKDFKGINLNKEVAGTYNLTYNEKDGYSLKPNMNPKFKLQVLIDNENINNLNNEEIKKGYISKIGIKTVVCAHEYILHVKDYYIKICDYVKSNKENELNIILDTFRKNATDTSTIKDEIKTPHHLLMFSENNDLFKVFNDIKNNKLYQEAMYLYIKANKYKIHDSVYPQIYKVDIDQIKKAFVCPLNKLIASYNLNLYYYWDAIELKAGSQETISDQDANNPFYVHKKIIKNPDGTDSILLFYELNYWRIKEKDIK